MIASYSHRLPAEYDGEAFDDGHVARLLVVGFKGLGIGTCTYSTALDIYASLVMASLFLTLAMAPAARGIRFLQSCTYIYLN